MNTKRKGKPDCIGCQILTWVWRCEAAALITATHVTLKNKNKNIECHSHNGRISKQNNALVRNANAVHGSLEVTVGKSPQQVTQRAREPGAQTVKGVWRNILNEASELTRSWREFFTSSHAQLKAWWRSYTWGWGECNIIGTQILQGWWRTQKWGGAGTNGFTNNSEHLKLRCC